ESALPAGAAIVAPPPHGNPLWMLVDPLCDVGLRIHDALMERHIGRERKMLILALCRERQRADGHDQFDQAHPNSPSVTIRSVARRSFIRSDTVFHLCKRRHAPAEPPQREQKLRTPPRGYRPCRILQLSCIPPRHQPESDQAHRRTDHAGCCQSTVVWPRSTAEPRTRCAPLPLWGGVGGGGSAIPSQLVPPRLTAPPPPHPSPTRGEGADRVRRLHRFHFTEHALVFVSYDFRQLSGVRGES